ncbi:MAG: hypothetical protein MZV65_14445 [Chromatiales bacterium]|nr:hypothetical protein [Chromatiales bacterium]
MIFPEIDYDKIDAIRGMDITITTTARSDDGRAARCWMPSTSRSAELQDQTDGQDRA